MSRQGPPKGAPSKKQIQAEAARLRRRPGWDPGRRASADPMEQLRELDQESQNARTYDESTGCEACLQARAESDDESALCPTHLEQALGF